jgi:hypothetical protein
MRAGSTKSLISKRRLPFDFNVEFKVLMMKFQNVLRNEIQDHKLKFFMVSFEAFNLLIQESYDVKRVVHDL